MHDIHPQGAQALPGIIDHFERQDRRFVGVNELLAEKYLGQVVWFRKRTRPCDLGDRCEAAISDILGTSNARRERYP